MREKKIEITERRGATPERRAGDYPLERVAGSVIGDVNMVVHSLKGVWRGGTHEEWPGQQEHQAPAYRTTACAPRHVASDTRQGAEGRDDAHDGRPYNVLALTSTRSPDVVVLPST